MNNVTPLRRNAVDSEWDQADTWPGRPGPLVATATPVPQAAHAATELGSSAASRSTAARHTRTALRAAAGAQFLARLVVGVFACIGAGATLGWLREVLP